jgi:hypothetical protein
MMGAIFVGSRSREMRLKQYAIVIIITMLQVCFVAFYMYTNDKIPRLENTEVESGE